MIPRVDGATMRHLVPSNPHCLLRDSQATQAAEADARKQAGFGGLKTIVEQQSGELRLRKSRSQKQMLRPATATRFPSFYCVLNAAASVSNSMSILRKDVAWTG